LLMHNPRMVDKEFEVTREIAAITAKRKKTDEDLHRIEELEWWGGLYTDPTDPGILVQPSSKIRKCLINAARITKSGKAIERALYFRDLNIPLAHDGGEDVKAIAKNPLYKSRLSVGVNGTKRVMRCRPQFFPWALTANGLFVEDAGLNFDEFKKIVDMAGVVEGIGDNRVNGYGRFTAKVQEV
jgi:hypothetical protein